MSTEILFIIIKKLEKTEAFLNIFNLFQPDPSPESTRKYEFVDGYHDLRIKSPPPQYEHVRLLGTFGAKTDYLIKGN